MARVLCLNPCPTSSYMPPFVAKGLTLPGIGSGVKPVARFGLQASCDSCEITAAFLAQLQPFLMSIQLPMCLLGCAMAIVDLGKALPDALGAGKIPPVPDPLAITDSLAKVVDICPKCLMGWDFRTICALIRDVLDLIITLLGCIRSVLSKLVTVSLRAAGLMMDPVESIRKTGDCLYGCMRRQLEVTTIQMDILGTLLKSIQFLLDFVAGEGGGSIDLTSMSANLGDLGLDAPLEPLIDLIDLIVSTLQIPRELAATCAEGP